MKAYRALHKDSIKNHRKNEWRHANKDNDNTKEKQKEYSKTYYEKLKEIRCQKQTQEQAPE